MTTGMSNERGSRDPRKFLTTHIVNPRDPKLKIQWVQRKSSVSFVTTALFAFRNVSFGKHVQSAGKKTY